MPLPPQLTTVTPLSKGLFLLLFIFLPFWGFYLGMRYEQSVTEEARLITEGQMVVLQQQTRANTPSPTMAAAQDELAECIVAARAEASTTKDYQPANLLVSFATTSTWASAISVIDSLHLTTATSSAAQNNFKKTKWLSVDVPLKEEFRWICILKKDPSVRFVSLNSAFELHE